MTFILLALALVWLVAGAVTVAVCWLQSGRAQTEVDRVCARTDRALRAQKQAAPRRTHAGRSRLRLV